MADAVRRFYSLDSSQKVLVIRQAAPWTYPAACYAIELGWPARNVRLDGLEDWLCWSIDSLELIALFSPR